MFSALKCDMAWQAKSWDAKTRQARWTREPGKQLPQCIPKEATLYFNSYTDLLVKCNDLCYKIEHS